MAIFMSPQKYKVGQTIPEHERSPRGTIKREAPMGSLTPPWQGAQDGFSHRDPEAPKVPTVGNSDFTTELHSNWRRRMKSEDDEMGAGVELSVDFVGGWRRRIMESLESGDVEGMKQEAALMAQLRTIEIGMESPDDKVALEANKFLLAQAGHGPINKVEHSMRYEGLPEDQLAAMVMSKLKRLGEHKPALLEAAKVALGGVVEGEYEEVKVESSSAEGQQLSGGGDE